MVHSFKIFDKHYFYDVESGSLIEVDKLLFDTLNNDTANYTPSQVQEAQEEIEELKAEGVIFCEAPQVETVEKVQEIKALCLHVCHDCNLRCGYCFADEGAYCGKREMLTLEVGCKAVDFLIANSGKRKVLEIDFFGGEPLMNMDVLKGVVEYANQRASQSGKVFKLTTTTNGVLLDKETSDYLNQHMENVVLSLDGRREINDNARRTINGKGSFDLVVDKFKYFRQIRGDKSYYLRGTFTSQNLDFATDVLFMQDLGFDQLSMEPVVLPLSHTMAIQQEHLPKIYEEYEKLTKVYLEKRKNPDTWFSFFHFVLDLNNSPCFKKKIVGCGAGAEYVAVAPNGDIYPCHQFVGKEQFLMGNVNEGKLDKVVSKDFLSNSLLTKQKCQDCFAKYHCSGGCHANAVAFNDDMQKPYEISCELMKKRLECSLHIFAQESCN